MKKLFFTLALIVPMLSFTGCGSGQQQDEPEPQKAEVNIKLDYTFYESGSMSRSGESAYQEFYNNYVKSKKIAPKHYNLTFKTEDGTVAQKVSGPWSGKSITLKEGKYVVSGNSYHTNYNSDRGGERYVCDSLYLTFDEPVSITKTTNSLTLTANYDCYLLLFNAATIKTIRSTFSVDPQKAGGVYYLFVNADTYNWMGSPSKLSIIVYKTDGTRVDMTIGGMGFEKGKYYFFDDMTNSFNIDPMPNGN